MWLFDRNEDEGLNSHKLGAKVVCVCEGLYMFLRYSGTSSDALEDPSLTENWQKQAKMQLMLLYLLNLYDVRALTRLRRLGDNEIGNYVLNPSPWLKMVLLWVS